MENNKNKVIDKYYKDNITLNKNFLNRKLNKIIVSSSEATVEEIAELLTAPHMYASNGNGSRDKKKIKHKLTYHRHTPEEQIVLSDRSLIVIDILLDKLKNMYSELNNSRNTLKQKDDLNIVS
tara:strand:- start:130 stop:498 length:369 start_codon:yes stop_codon:yes gene_type:complete